MMAANWLHELTRNSLGDFDVTDDLDFELSALAKRARSNEQTAWRLLEMLSWKIERFIQRFRSWDLAPFDLDDVTQQAYLVYLDTLNRWRPCWIDGRLTGFLYYFLRVFPCWLASAVRRWQRPTRAPVIRTRRAGSGRHAGDEGALVEDFCRNLGPQDATLVRLRLTRGFSVPRAAETMGIARRTAYRRWRHILELGREYLREAG